MEEESKTRGCGCGPVCPSPSQAPVGLNSGPSYLSSPLCLGRMSRAQLSGFASLPCYVLDVGAWANVLTAPSLGFLICRCHWCQGTSWSCCEVKWGKHATPLALGLHSMVVIVTWWGWQMSLQSVRTYGRWGLLTLGPTFQRPGLPTETQGAENRMKAQGGPWCQMRCWHHWVVNSTKIKANHQTRTKTWNSAFLISSINRAEQNRQDCVLTGDSQPYWGPRRSFWHWEGQFLWKKARKGLKSKGCTKPPGMARKDRGAFELQRL